MSHIAELVFTFLCSYAMHSMFLLSLAIAVNKFNASKKRPLAETIWRIALFGALITAAAQTSYVTREIAPSQSLEIATENIAPVVENLPTPITKSVASPAITNDKTPTTSFTPSKLFSDQKVIQLPANYKFYADLLALAWCALAVFVLAGINLSVFYLNRKIALMPELEDEELLRFAASRMPFGRQIHIHHGDAWSSPLLCPNGQIFLPDWALEELDKTQCKAMLAHEIAHLLRHDRYWRLAHQIMLRLFFFQILNRYAVKQLELLAEFDCDQAALEHSNAESFSQTLMQCAQMHINNHPTFALPMAKPSSLLQRISLLLNEDRMPAPSFSKKSLCALCAVAISGLSAISYATPNLRFADTHETSKSPTLNLHQRTSIATPVKPQTSPIAVTKLPVQDSMPSTKPNEKLSTSETPQTSQANLATQADQIARLTQARQAWKDNQMQLAHQLFSELAVEGNAEAQAALGEMLWYGEGAATDVNAAQAWITKAANQGNARARQFLELFAERDQRRAELDFYIKSFDGGDLKWSAQTCPAPQLNSAKIDKEERQASILAMNQKLDCYNRYVNQLKAKLKDRSYIPSDLLHLMRAEEIEQSLTQAENVFYQAALLEKTSNEQLVTTFNQLYRQQAQTERKTDDKFDGGKYWRERAEYDRRMSPQMKEETGERKNQSVYDQVKR